MSCSRVCSESKGKRIGKETVSEIGTDAVMLKVNTIESQITIGTLETKLRIDGRVQPNKIDSRQVLSEKELNTWISSNSK